MIHSGTVNCSPSFPHYFYCFKSVLLRNIAKIRSQFYLRKIQKKSCILKRCSNALNKNMFGTLFKIYNYTLDMQGITWSYTSEFKLIIMPSDPLGTSHLQNFCLKSKGVEAFAAPQFLSSLSLQNF